MKIINKPIRGGKTYAMMEIFLANNMCLLVMNEQERNRLIKQFNVPKEKQKHIKIWQDFERKIIDTNMPY